MKISIKCDCGNKLSIKENNEQSIYLRVEKNTAIKNREKGFIILPQSSVVICVNCSSAICIDGYIDMDEDGGTE